MLSRTPLPKELTEPALLCGNDDDALLPALLCGSELLLLEGTELLATLALSRRVEASEAASESVDSPRRKEALAAAFAAAFTVLVKIEFEFSKNSHAASRSPSNWSPSSSSPLEKPSRS